MINKKILPIIPEEGSVGASGDLTPLSYVASVLSGEQHVRYQGQKHRTKDVFEKENLFALKLRPKEALAIMNGTSVMTALACFAYDRSRYLVRMGSCITALVVESIQGNVHHFAKKIFEVKPFPGQARVASWIRQQLSTKRTSKIQESLQDRYSIRCAPHISRGPRRCIALDEKLH